MREFSSVLLFVIAVVFLFGCRSEISEVAYNELLTGLRAMGVHVDAQAVDEDILQGQRRWLTINGVENISVYLYESPRKMEQDASYIDEGGSGYTNGRKSVEISWVSYPHFYKKDNIIVLYVGEDPDLITALEDIMGEQFVGYRE